MGTILGLLFWLVCACVVGVFLGKALALRHEKRRTVKDLRFADLRSTRRRENHNPADAWYYRGKDAGR